MASTTGIKLHTDEFQPALWHKIVLGVAALAGLYAITLIYLSGNIFLAMAVLALFLIGFYIFLSNRFYAARYLFPGLLGMSVFVLFPLLYTVWIGFTNYSSEHLLTLQRVQNYFLQETYKDDSARSYKFKVLPVDQAYQIELSDKDANVVLYSQPFEMADIGSDGLTIALSQPQDSASAALAMKEVIQFRDNLSQLNIELDDGTTLRMSGLRDFSSASDLYSLNDDGTLVNNQTGEILSPNFDTGYYQNSAGEAIPPGFRVNVGFQNFIGILTNRDLQGPFFRIFVWTITFAGLSVLFTLIVGTTLACLLNWKALKFKGLYRGLLFLPYAVPGFISILVFRGLFNNNFGEINLILDSLFGIRPQWFSDPLLAKAMILIVNTWLGYPYIMVLCMGLLKSIPEDLYEASAISGATPLENFRYITAPLLIKPLMPLLISSFAFNFNNFVIIALLTSGRPDFLDATVPAGTTDILVSYTYRIAFEDSGKDFGLAAAISTVIFFMVAMLAVWQLKLTKVAEQTA